MAAGFGRLILNPNATPFFPNDTVLTISNPSDEYNHIYDMHQQNLLQLQNHYYYYYYYTNTSFYYPNTVFSSTPPPPVAPPPTPSRAKRSGRKSKHWSWKRGGGIDRLMRLDPHGPFTTVMIRNIPNQYTEMVKEFLDHHCSFANRHSSYNEGISAYDFLYLPIDFGTNVNKGFAFVNFTDPRAVWRFYRCCANQKWAHFRSSKRCDVTYARIQGKEALEKHFQGVKFECTDDEYLPVLYTPARDGSGAAVAEKTIGGRLRDGSGIDSELVS